MLGDYLPGFLDRPLQAADGFNERGVFILGQSRFDEHFGTDHILNQAVVNLVAQQATIANQQLHSLAKQLALRIDALSVPLGQDLIPDGDPGDAAYSSGPQLRLGPNGDGARAIARVARTETDLWVAFSGLARSGLGAVEASMAGVLLDIDLGREATAQADDWGYYVDEAGHLSIVRGDGAGGLQPIDPEHYPTGFDAVISRSESAWSAELRIPLDIVPGGRVGVAFFHIRTGVVGAAQAWPHTAELTVPRSWAETLVGDFAGRLLIPLVYK